MSGKIIVIAEQFDGKIKPVSLELAGFGKEISQTTGGELIGVALGFPALALAREFARASGLKVIGLEHPNLETYNADSFVQALSKFIPGQNPDYILIPHTAIGWDFAPRLAAALNGSCLSVITGLKMDGRLRFLRPICSGKLMAEVEPAPDTVAVITVNPGAARAIKPDAPGQAEFVKMDLAETATKNLGYTEAKRGALDLTKAEVIVAAGRGLGKVENLELVKTLAGLFDKSAIGASRAVVDAGWLPYEHQVGQTGQTVHPKLYLALGISGAIQHLVGMTQSELIVAVNTDPKAAIFNVAHLGVVQDLIKFLPALIEKIKEIK